MYSLPFSTVFGDGSYDARDGESLSIRSDFFSLNSGVREFQILLNVTKSYHDGRREIVSHGITYINVVVNSPPENGTCQFK